MKLTPEIIQQIHTLYAQGLTYRDIAAQLSISKTSVADVINNRKTTNAPTESADPTLTNQIIYLKKQLKLEQTKYNELLIQETKIKTEIENNEVIEWKPFIPINTQYFRVVIQQWCDSLPVIFTDTMPRMSWERATALHREFTRRAQQVLNDTLQKIGKEMDENARLEEERDVQRS